MKSGFSKVHLLAERAWRWKTHNGREEEPVIPRRGLQMG